MWYLNLVNGEKGFTGGFAGGSAVIIFVDFCSNFKSAYIA